MKRRILFLTMCVAAGLVACSPTSDISQSSTTATQSMTTGNSSSTNDTTGDASSNSDNNETEMESSDEILESVASPAMETPAEEPTGFANEEDKEKVTTIATYIAEGSTEELAIFQNQEGSKFNVDLTQEGIVMSDGGLIDGKKYGVVHNSTIITEGEYQSYEKVWDISEIN